MESKRIELTYIFAIKKHSPIRYSNKVSYGAPEKKLKIGYNLELFLVKSTLSGGINRMYDEIPLAWDEIRLDGGWVVKFN